MNSKPKRFLLIRGMVYYPRQDTGDWIGTYETREAAQSALDTLIAADKSVYDPPGVWEEGYMWSVIVDLYQWMYDTKEQAPNE